MPDLCGAALLESELNHRANLPWRHVLDPELRQLPDISFNARLDDLALRVERHFVLLPHGNLRVERRRLKRHPHRVKRRRHSRQLPCLRCRLKLLGLRHALLGAGQIADALLQQDRFLVRHVSQGWDGRLRLSFVSAFRNQRRLNDRRREFIRQPRGTDANHAPGRRMLAINLRLLVPNPFEPRRHRVDILAHPRLGGLRQPHRLRGGLGHRRIALRHRVEPAHDPEHLTPKVHRVEHALVQVGELDHVDHVADLGPPAKLSLVVLVVV